MRHTTAALSTIHKAHLCRLFVAAAVPYVWVYFLIPFRWFPLSAPSDAVLQFCQPNVCEVCLLIFLKGVSLYVLQWWGVVCVCVSVCMGLCVVCGDGGIVSSVRTAVHTALGSASFKGAGQDRAGGARGQRDAALLIPQDGVLVVELQVLHRSATGLLSATVPVFHNLEGLLHFSVPETQTSGHSRSESSITYCNYGGTTV